MIWSVLKNFGFTNRFEEGPSIFVGSVSVLYLPKPIIELPRHTNTEVRSPVYTTEQDRDSRI